MSYTNIKKINNLIGKKVWFYFSILLIMMLILAVLETLSIAAIPALLGFILDPKSIIEKYNFLSNFRIIENFFNTQNILILITIIFSIFLVKNIYVAFFFYIKGLIVRNFISKTTIKIFNNYLNLPLIEFEKYHSSFITNVVSTQTGLSYNFLDAFVVFLKEIIILIFLCIFAYSIEPTLLIIVLSVFSIFSLLYFLIIKKILNKIGNETIRFKTLFYKYLSEALNLFKDMKILSNEKAFINQFSYSTFGLHKTNHIRGFLISLPKPILETISILLILLFTLYFLETLQSKDQVITTLALLVIISVRFLPALNLITSSVSTMKSTYPSLKLLLEELYKFNHIEKEISNNIIFDVNSSDNVIELKNVNFSYTDNKDSILENINISVKKNSFIAIIGDTGSGKSTLINIMLGLYKSNSGKIKYNLNKSNGQIGYVPQNIYLMDNTLEQNIVLGKSKDQINQAQLNDALQKAELTEFLKSKEEGLNLKVGEKGVMLSGGEIQRIGIARALYQNPKVLFFDEATSSLDLKTEEKILKTLIKIKNVTKIFITHRTWNMSYFDKVFHVKNGKVLAFKDTNKDQ